MQNRGPWTQTSGVRQFFPLDPQPEDVKVSDIFHALSRLCRYNGHSQSHYSVAHHSLLVSRIVAHLGGTPNEVRWGLCHDFAEAYVGDVSAPIKNHPSMAAFRQMEERVMQAIADRLGLEGPEPALVKYVDRQIIAFESESPFIFPSRHPEWPAMEKDPRIESFLAQHGPISSDGASSAHAPMPSADIPLSAFAPVLFVDMVGALKEEFSRLFP